MNGKKKFKRYGWLAGAGGFLDSFGGGGWGPIVTSTLITKGRTPQVCGGLCKPYRIFYNTRQCIYFFYINRCTKLAGDPGLVIGGVIAAPIAAKLAGKLPRKASFILLGAVVSDLEYQDSLINNLDVKENFFKKLVYKFGGLY